MAMFNIVIVTYGNRWKYLQQVLKRCEGSPHIKRIVLVDNNSGYDLQAGLEDMKAAKVHLISLAENEGSAGGFKSGIVYLREQDSGSYILLLDDDNLVAEEVFDRLQMIVESQQAGVFALLRNNRSYLVNIANGHPVVLYFPQTDSYFGFDLLRYLQKKYVLRKSGKAAHSGEENTIIPMAPYGGLFFPAQLIDRVGLPDERMFVYADDFEFTYRFTLQKIPICLLRDCRIEDLEESWIETSSRSPLVRLMSLYNYKAFFTVRNVAFFSAKRLKANNWRFFMNRTIVLSHAYLYAVLNGKLQEYRYLHRLILEGESEVFNNKQILQNEMK